VIIAVEGIGLGYFISEISNIRVIDSVISIGLGELVVGIGIIGD
jgi:hypothetical protein